MCRAPKASKLLIYYILEKFLNNIFDIIHDIRTSCCQGVLNHISLTVKPNQPKQTKLESILDTTSHPHRPQWGPRVTIQRFHSIHPDQHSKSKHYILNQNSQSKFVFVEPQNFICGAQKQSELLNVWNVGISIHIKTLSKNLVKSPRKPQSCRVGSPTILRYLSPTKNYKRLVARLNLIAISARTSCLKTLCRPSKKIE